MALADKFENAHKMAVKEPAIVTELEVKVLERYLMKGVPIVAKELGISQQTVYAVFQRIRERRRRFQLGVNFWNNMVAKEKRLFLVLTPRPKPKEEEDDDLD